METNNESNIPTAFISCSLREEDRRFIEFVEEEVYYQNFNPIGTVGRWDASPQNPIDLMKGNIKKADILIVVATERYRQTDSHTGKQSNGLSEMIHVESGMAFASNKPVIVFEKEGTNVGSFLPNLTQYITLKGDWRTDKKHRKLIDSLFDKAHTIVENEQSKKNLKVLGRIAFGSLAFIGAGVVMSKVKIVPKP